jgi:hypothetical protein
LEKLPDRPFGGAADGCLALRAGLVQRLEPARRDLLLRLGRILGGDDGLELGPLQLLVEIEQLERRLAPGRGGIGKRRLRLDDRSLVVEVGNAEA